MTEHKSYERYIESIKNWLFGLPDSEVLMPMLRTRLTPEEAEFLADIPVLPNDIEQLAEKLGTSADTLMAWLDPLAQRGLVFRHESKDTIRYALNDSLLVFYRSPFWGGGTDEASRELAAYSNKYFFDGYGAEFGKYETRALRAIPVETSIKDTREIKPFEDILKVLDEQDYFCTSTCPCRQRKELDPDTLACHHEKFNCIHFGRLAKYMVQQGMGKEITREETREILQAAADEGLVHGISNIQSGMDTICNCCPCCCMFFESLKTLQLQGIHASNYILQIDREECVVCGLCVQRCPVDAIQLEDDAAALTDPSGCMGCGVCVYKCPTGALGLVKREEEQTFPKSFRENAVMMQQENCYGMPPR